MISVSDDLAIATADDDKTFSTESLDLLEKRLRERAAEIGATPVFSINYASQNFRTVYITSSSTMAYGDAYRIKK